MDEEKKEIIEIEKVNDTESTEVIQKETTAERKEDAQAGEVQKPKKNKKGFCITSMVLGIVALVFFCLWYISIPCGILAIIFGVLGIKSANKGMAIAGLVTGSIGLVISTLIIIMIFILGIAVGVSDVLDDVDDDQYYNHHYRNYHFYD